MITYRLLFPPERSYWPITGITILITVWLWSVAWKFFRIIQGNKGYIVGKTGINSRQLFWGVMSEKKAKKLKSENPDDIYLSKITSTKAVFYFGFFFIVGLLILMLGFGELD